MDSIDAAKIDLAVESLTFTSFFLPFQRVSIQTFLADSVVCHLLRGVFPDLKCYMQSFMEVQESEAAEMAEQLRALPALTGDLRAVPSTHAGQYITTHFSGSKGS